MSILKLATFSALAAGVISYVEGIPSHIMTPMARETATTTTFASQVFFDTSSVTCLFEACIRETSYCWYWPTMVIHIGSLGAEPAFTLAPFATCEQDQQTATTLQTITITNMSPTENYSIKTGNSMVQETATIADEGCLRQD